MHCYLLCYIVYQLRCCLFAYLLNELVKELGTILQGNTHKWIWQDFQKGSVFAHVHKQHYGEKVCKQNSRSVYYKNKAK